MIVGFPLSGDNTVTGDFLYRLMHHKLKGRQELQHYSGTITTQNGGFKLYVRKLPV